MTSNSILLENDCGKAVVDLHGARVVSWLPIGTSEVLGPGGFGCGGSAVAECLFRVVGRRDTGRFWSELSLAGETGRLRFAVTVRLAGGLAVELSVTDADGAPAAFGATLSASLAVADPATCSFDDLAGTFRTKDLPPSNLAADFRLASPSSRFFLRDAARRRIFIMSGAGSRRVRAASPALVEYGGDSSRTMLAVAVRDESAMPIDTSALRRETTELQNRIDSLAASGGGTLVIPPGVHLSGALFFKSGVNLHLEEGAVLLGADDASDYPMRETRLGGKTLRYYPALVNADGCDGFRISGRGVIDGNGLEVWRGFWESYQHENWHRNTDGSLVRPRLVYVSNSRGVEIADATLRDSRRWTLHLYRCHDSEVRDCRIECRVLDGVHGPSTDAIDLDACSGITIRRVFMSVNDDAVVAKGGCGPWADDPERHPDNGPTADILIEDCVFGTYSHSCLTLGSECIGAERITMRRCLADQPGNLIDVKMRPDTHFIYHDIAVEDCEGILLTGIRALPWTAHADLEGRTDLPRSLVEHIRVRCPALHAARSEERCVPDYCDVRGVSASLAADSL